MVIVHDGLSAIGSRIGSQPVMPPNWKPLDESKVVRWMTSGSLNKVDSIQQQLELPFEVGQKHVAIVAMDVIHGLRLRRLIESLQPQVVVDVRYLLRFDLPGTSRNEIFHTLQESKSSYVKATIALHELSYRHFMSGDAAMPDSFLREVTERDNTRIIVMVSKIDDCKSIATYLNIALSSSRHSWSFHNVF